VAAAPGETPARVRAAIDAQLGSREMGIRGEGWRVAQAMMRQSPWFGVGPGRYAYDYSEYSTQQDRTHAYNIVLHTGADLGWVGLTMYLALWARVAWISIAAAFARVRTPADLPERAAALATHAMIVAFFVRSQSEHFLANLTTSFRLLLLVGILFGLAEGLRARRSASADLAQREPESAHG
jgi:O-antigen ligase